MYIDAEAIDLKMLIEDEATEVPPIRDQRDAGRLIDVHEQLVRIAGNSSSQWNYAAIVLHRLWRLAKEASTVEHFETANEAWKALVTALRRGPQKYEWVELDTARNWNANLSMKLDAELKFRAGCR